jgi:hypothetical protein
MAYKSGDLVDFLYSGKYARKTRGKGFEGHRITTIHDLHPIAMVLYWGNDIVHGLNFNYFKKAELIPFFEKMLKVEINQKNWHLIKDIGHLDIGDPKAYYHNFLKSYLKHRPSASPSAYRGYIPSKIQSIKPITIGRIFDRAEIRIV